MNVYDFALKMEMDGNAYYEKLAAETGNAGLKGVFTNLAADEQKHYDYIRSLKGGAGGDEMADTTVLDNAKNVFGALARDEKTLSEMKKAVQGYQHARRIEAESVKLYEEMAGKEADPARKGLLFKIAAEERKHYNIMDNLSDFTLRPEYYLEWREFSNLEQL